MKLQIGDLCIPLDTCDGFDANGHVAKVINIVKEGGEELILLEFNDYLDNIDRSGMWEGNGHDGNDIGEIKGKDGCCWWYNTFHSLKITYRPKEKQNEDNN